MSRTRRLPVTCRACGKTIFSSRKRALTAMNSRRAHARPTDRKPVAVYRCPSGNGWHMTSVSYAS